MHSLEFQHPNCMNDLVPIHHRNKAPSANIIASVECYLLPTNFRSLTFADRTRFSLRSNLVTVSPQKALPPGVLAGLAWKYGKDLY